jgi:hypothetical protein
MVTTITAALVVYVPVMVTPSVLALMVIFSGPPLSRIVRSTACRSTVPVRVPSLAHGVPVKNTVDEARLAPFCAMKKSRSKLVGPTDDVVSACQFPDTLAFPPGRLLDPASRQETHPQKHHRHTPDPNGATFHEHNPALPNVGQLGWNSRLLQSSKSRIFHRDKLWLAWNRNLPALKQAYSKLLTDAPYLSSAT